MTYCKNCGAGVKPAESFCSSCGEGLPEAAGTPSGRVKNRRLIVWISVSLLVVGAAAALLLVLLSSPYIAVPGRYHTIQEAIDAARDGKIIVVEQGIYRENIDFKGKAVTLRSSDPDDPETVAATILDGGGSGSVVTFQNGEGEDSVISGLTITGGAGTWLELDYGEEGEQVKLAGFFGGGIMVLNGSTPTIKNNIIHGNECFGEDGGGGGIAIWSSSAGIHGNTIRENRAANGGGLFVGGGSFASVEENVISENRAANGGGIYIGMDSSVILEENTISGNKAE